MQESSAVELANTSWTTEPLVIGVLWQKNRIRSGIYPKIFDLKRRTKNEAY
jgi:hypothetical protein